MYFFSLYRSSSLFSWTVFDSISSNIDQVLSMNPSANVFVFWELNLHRKDWLTYSDRTDRPVEHCCNLSQLILLRWLAFLLRPLTVSLAIFHCFIYFFFVMLVFVLQWLSLHWKILIMLLFQSTNQDDPFNCIAYDYSRPEWDNLCNLLRDVPWEEIFKLSVYDAAS